MCQNLVPLVNIKIAGKWMFIPLKMVLIGIDPYPDSPMPPWYPPWYPHDLRGLPQLREALQLCWSLASESAAGLVGYKPWGKTSSDLVICSSYYGLFVFFVEYCLFPNPNLTLQVYWIVGLRFFSIQTSHCFRRRWVEPSPTSLNDADAIVWSGKS